MGIALHGLQRLASSASHARLHPHSPPCQHPKPPPACRRHAGSLAVSPGRPWRWGTARTGWRPACPCRTCTARTTRWRPLGTAPPACIAGASRCMGGQVRRGTGRGSKCERALGAGGPAALLRALICIHCSQHGCCTQERSSQRAGIAPPPPPARPTPPLANSSHHSHPPEELLP